MSWKTIEESQTFQEVTIYSHQDSTIQGMGIMRPILGYSKIECSRATIEIGKYAQYARAVTVKFVPRGKRSERQYEETSRPTTVVLKGYGHPDVPREIGPGPEPLHDEKWHTQFAEFLEEHRSNPGVEVLLDLRGHDTGESLPRHSSLGAEARITPPKPNAVFLTGEALAVWEGQPVVRAHVRRERNQAIVQAKREAVLRSTGRLECEACGFDFLAFYGIEFCEVHHLSPLGEQSGTVETRLEDLAIICSNCHRVIHRHSPFFSIPELKTVIQSCRASNTV